MAENRENHDPPEDRFCATAWLGAINGWLTCAPPPPSVAAEIEREKRGGRYGRK